MVTKLKNKNTLITITFIVMIASILIPLGFATGVASSEVYFDNTKSSAGGQYLKDAIDGLNDYCSSNCPKGYTCKNNSPKCRRATSLHTETCSNSNTSYYCQHAGFTNGETITYGNTSTTAGVLTTGDAFDCDVNGDGTYDSATERFYYVSDYYDTSTKSFNDKVAVLVYNSNVKGGVSSTQSTAYDCKSQNFNGPVTALEQLPTTTQWSNIRLYKDSRQILTLNNGTSTSGGTLPTNFSYAGYAARLLTYQEAYHGCYTSHTIIIIDEGLSGSKIIDKCLFLMSNTAFSTASYPYYYWLESPVSNKTNGVVTADSKDGRLSYQSANYTSWVGVRPVIEILKSDISY